MSLKEIKFDENKKLEDYDINILILLGHIKLSEYFLEFLKTFKIESKLVFNKSECE
jgi:hypothetical protein